VDLKRDKVISATCTGSFPAYIDRFGDDIFSEGVFILYEKIKTYNLRYRDKKGNFRPVRFSSYVWK